MISYFKRGVKHALQRRGDTEGHELVVLVGAIRRLRAGAIASLLVGADRAPRRVAEFCNALFVRAAILPP